MSKRKIKEIEIIGAENSTDRVDTLKMNIPLAEVIENLKILNLLQIPESQVNK